MNGEREVIIYGSGSGNGNGNGNRDGNGDLNPS